ncbi:hypothetical protein MHBO_004019 [Bonamia ostreae]|uniref:Uncharacterized protein n=1 Tax=Bonamia ostreae TaxID=126728 RepID=A0ABV2AS62_9EUKA
MGNSKSRNKSFKEKKIDDDVDQLFQEELMLKHQRNNGLQKTIRANMKETLKGTRKIKETVVVPEGESENEWISIHSLFSFFDLAIIIH